MRWQDGRRSGNVEDRRGVRPGGVVLGGGATLVVVIVAMLFGADPRQLLQQLALNADAPQSTTAPAAPDPAQEQLKEFASVVLAETEDVWTEQFRLRGQAYEEPTLVLFAERVESACGMAGAAVGPFYCPGDSRLYLDLSFFDELESRFGAPGDFAQAYVISHEVGHHVQNLLGVSERVHRLQQDVGEREANALSVRLELQADFYAGVWAHFTERMKHNLEPGDIEEALNAAHQIGDDNLQKRSRGMVVPESFTHGTSEQRMHWFMLGYRSGDMSQGDTFASGAI